MNYQLNTTTENTSGTSFHGVTITASVLELKEAFGEPQYQRANINDKVQYEWVFKDSNDHIITLYDWKEYRYFSLNEEIEWHIGGHSLLPCSEAKEFLTLKLNK